MLLQVLLDAVTTQGGSLQYIALAVFSHAQQLQANTGSIAASLIQVSAACSASAFTCLVLQPST